MKTLYLNRLELKTFTEQDAEDYCLLNNINPDNITILDLGNNNLTDISGIKIFENLENLYLCENKFTDISVLKDLKDLKYLSIDFLKLESDQIKYIKSLKNLETLYCKNAFKDMSVLNELNKNIKIIS